MGLRDNFKQAAKELIDGPRPPQSQGYQPAPETPPVYSREPEARPEFDPPEPEFDPPDFTDYIPQEPKEFVTVIAPGTIVRGTVESEGSVEVYGEVQGDITTVKDLTLKGKVQGNAMGGNVDASGLQMVGNIVASGIATIDSGSEVEGDVAAESMTLNGSIWGDVKVSPLLSLESSAVISGYVSADKLSVSEGAIIQGEILIGKKMLPPKRSKSVSEE